MVNGEKERLARVETKVDTIIRCHLPDINKRIYSFEERLNKVDAKMTYIFILTIIIAFLAGINVLSMLKAGAP